MRWTHRQHLQMAQHLDTKASLAVGEKKLRLGGLAAASRLLASMALEQESGDVAGRRHNAVTPRIAEALFQPSFDPETLLRVIDGPNGTTLELTSAENRFARQITNRAIVAPDCALQFWSELDALLVTPFNIEETAGFDGITIKVDCRTPTGSVDFEVWSPRTTTHAGRIIDLIYNIAWESSSATSAVECLEHLRGYLRD